VLDGVVYMTKSRGPRTEPRGTPQEEICSEEKSDERRVIRMLWSIVSKAAERSRRQKHDNFCDPMALIR